jgi:hypothetical protein
VISCCPIVLQRSILTMRLDTDDRQNVRERVNDEHWYWSASGHSWGQGRVDSGVGEAGRQCGFAAEASFRDRGKCFDQQLALMTQIWSGQPVSRTIGEVGPLPVQQGGPELLIGGFSPKVRERIARWGNRALIGVGGGGPEMVRQSLEMT